MIIIQMDVFLNVDIKQKAKKNVMIVTRFFMIVALNININLIRIELIARKEFALIMRIPFKPTKMRVQMWIEIKNGCILCKIDPNYKSQKKIKIIQVLVINVRIILCTHPHKVRNVIKDIFLEILDVINVQRNRMNILPIILNQAKFMIAQYVRGQY
ncbi:unnamed protein product [Paramecium sonneborni]|uniref:Uncharacterized protein n=1 Tax=Paramecium sonneborni TaxID=65129 RepID=A0A8S1R351_9CILI|nr:unnamed protein product [Paramecium sonneborni]